MIEKTIEDHLKKRCKENKIFILKNTGMNGIPDRLLLKNGKYLFVETKKPGEKARLLQQKIMKKLTEHGAACCIIDSKTGVDYAIELFVKRKIKSKTIYDFTSCTDDKDS